MNPSCTRCGAPPRILHHQFNTVYLIRYLECTNEACSHRYTTHCVKHEPCIQCANTQTTFHGFISAIENDYLIESEWHCMSCRLSFSRPVILSPRELDELLDSMRLW